MDNYTQRCIKRRINRLDRRGLLNGKRIVLFGASISSKYIKTCLLELGYKPSSIIDNDSRKIGNLCMNFVVDKPEEVLLPFDGETAILLYSPGFYREITRQLEQYGYKSRKSIHVLNLKVNDSLKIFAYFTLLRLRGIRWYNKLMRGTDANTKLFIAPYTGTGDIYLAGLFFNEYLRRNNITDYVFVVVTGACKKVAEMFNINNIRVVTPQISDDIINLEKALKIKLNIIVLNDGWGADARQWIRGYKELNFEKVFRYFVFGFDDNVAFELPPHQDNSAAVDALFEKYSLLKEKTVVLSPYSNTLFELPDDFWEEIAAHFTERGYTVCTNCAAASERPVKGTREVFFPFGIAVDFLNAAGCFIGIRSGLCDIISSSICRKVIIYEKDGLFYRCSPYEYFSLEKMGLCSDAVELEYREDLREEIVTRIKQLLLRGNRDGEETSTNAP